MIERDQVGEGDRQNQTAFCRSWDPPNHNLTHNLGFAEE